MQYRRELYAYERAKENKEYNFERLNPNDRYIKMAQSFFDNSNITIEECIQILEKETMEVRNLVDCYKNAIKQYYSENQKPLYTVRGRQHEILRNNNDEQQEERINRTNI